MEGGVAANTSQAVKVLSWFQRNLTDLKQEAYPGETLGRAQGRPELGD